MEPSTSNGIRPAFNIQTAEGRSERARHAANAQWERRRRYAMGGRPQPASQGVPDERLSDSGGDHITKMILKEIQDRQELIQHTEREVAKLSEALSKLSPGLGSSVARIRNHIAANGSNNVGGGPGRVLIQPRTYKLKARKGSSLIQNIYDMLARRGGPMPVSEIVQELVNRKVPMGCGGDPMKIRHICDNYAHRRGKILERLFVQGHPEVHFQVNPKSRPNL